jgi:hypothetical protein
MLVSLVILVAGFVAHSSSAPLPILSKNRHGVYGHQGEGLMRTAMCELCKLSVLGADHRFDASWIVCAAVICCHLICEELETYRQ